MEFDNIINEAQLAFFAVIAKYHPDIKTGDFPPLAQHNFDIACNEAVTIWLEGNRQI
jgi:hypothetical protein